MEDNTKLEVFIDGVKYVPAKVVIANKQLIEDALIAQYWGTPVDEKGRAYAEDLRVLVSDSLSVDEGESIKEFIERLADLIG